MLHLIRGGRKSDHNLATYPETRTDFLHILIKKGRKGKNEKRRRIFLPLLHEGERKKEKKRGGGTETRPYDQKHVPYILSMNGKGEEKPSTDPPRHHSERERRGRERDRPLSYEI